jgi:hypothetical protein
MSPRAISTPRLSSLLGVGGRPHQGADVLAACQEFVDDLAPQGAGRPDDEDREGG